MLCPGLLIALSNGNKYSAVWYHFEIVMDKIEFCNVHEL